MPEILEVTLTQSYHAQTLVNRWNYLASGDAPGDGFAWGLNEVLGFHPIAGVPPSGSLLEKILVMQSGNCQSVQAICINPYNPEDFDEAPFIPRPVGSGLGDDQPPFVSVGFRSNQTRRDIRRATKRIGGTVEGLFSDGGALTPAGVTDAIAIASAMNAVLTFTEGAAVSTYTPCVVQKEKYAVPGSDPVRYAYRYIRPLDNTGRDAQLLKVATGITWENYSDARSQVSRQYGRGI